MKKVLFVINTLGQAGAEKALLELMKHFSPDEYEVSLYVLLGQGELIHDLPRYVKVLNKDYSDASVLSGKGKKISQTASFQKIISEGRFAEEFPRDIMCISRWFEKKETWNR